MSLYFQHKEQGKVMMQEQNDVDRVVEEYIAQVRIGRAGAAAEAAAAATTTTTTATTATTPKD
jgi:hypothetical protein